MSHIAHRISHSSTFPHSTRAGEHALLLSPNTLSYQCLSCLAGPPSCCPWSSLSFSGLLQSRALAMTLLRPPPRDERVISYIGPAILFYPDCEGRECALLAGSSVMSASSETTLHLIDSLTSLLFAPSLLLFLLTHTPLLLP